MSDFRVESVANSNDGNTITPSGSCVIRVLGIRGGGGNSLQNMINESIKGVEFIAVNTDSQALSKSTSPFTIFLVVSNIYLSLKPKPNALKSSILAVANASGVGNV